jgi:ABC-type molybdate transport system ATPase subunit
VAVGAATFAATLTAPQTEQLSLALLRREAFSLRTSEAALRVTQQAGRVELAVRVGGATFAATLTEQQAQDLALALLRGVPEPRHIRAVPRRINLEGA